MNTTLIRQVEYGVLDEEFKRYDLLRLPEDLAITRLLKITGDIMRDVSRGGLARMGPSSIHSFASLLTRGLSHCLRWVCRTCPPGESVHRPEWMQEDAQAVELLEWGMKYARLATDHVAWSNSLIEASIDPDQRLIVFEPPEYMDVAYFKRQAQADVDWCTAELNEGFPRDAFVRIFNDWQNHAEWKSDHLEFSAHFVRTQARFADMRDWITLKLFPGLSEDCNLGSYQVGHLRTFFAALYTVCECIRTLEDESDGRVGPDNQMGTWTFQLPRSVFIEWLVHATGLLEGLVVSILSDMTIEPTRFHCSVTATPFILSRRNTLFLLPRLFSVLSPQRSFAAALTRGSGRKAYERITDVLERYHVGNVTSVLRGHGLNVACQKSFITPEGQKITPDFIVSDCSTSTVVVGDFKNALAATAVSEVTNRLREYKKGVLQVERYIDRFLRFPQLLDPIVAAPAEARKVHGLLLFRVPMPLPVARSPLVEVEDWHSMQRRLEGMQSIQAGDLLPPDTGTDLASALAFMHQDITVRDWTYRRSVIFWPDRQHIGL